MAEEIEYERYSLKSYRHWTSYLHYNQAYLGRCYIALNRSGNLDPFVDTSPAEQSELELVVAELKDAITRLYQPDIYNYANFRNTWPRCHWHVIPRYQRSRVLNGQVFTDENWGRNYAPYNREFTCTPQLIARIREDIQAELS